MHHQRRKNRHFATETIPSFPISISGSLIAAFCKFSFVWPQCHSRWCVGEPKAAAFSSSSPHRCLWQTWFKQITVRTACVYLWGGKSKRVNGFIIEGTGADVTVEVVCVCFHFVGSRVRAGARECVCLALEGIPLALCGTSSNPTCSGSFSIKMTGSSIFKSSQ